MNKINLYEIARKVKRNTKHITCTMILEQYRKVRDSLNKQGKYFISFRCYLVKLEFFINMHTQYTNYTIPKLIFIKADNKTGQSQVQIN